MCLRLLALAVMLLVAPVVWAQTINVTAFNASGSNQTTTADCVKGIASLSLTSAIDFKSGEGLTILGCGPLSSLSIPTVSITNIGTAGSATDYYGVIAVDINGGGSGYTLVATNTAASTLNGTNYNAIHFTPVGSARGYALVGRTSGSPALLQYMPWEEPAASYSATASRTSNVVTVTVTSATSLSFFPTWFVTLSGCSDNSFNGTFQVSSTGQTTFSYSQTAANSSATRCTVTINPTFFDFGTTYPLPYNGATFFSTSATNGIFSAVITALSGTTASLSAAPSANLSAQTVYHDDTAAWKSAIAASTAPPYTYPVFCPTGTYNISSDLNIVSGFTMNGSDYTTGPYFGCFLFQLNPGADIFRAGASTSAIGMKLSNAILRGGRIGFDSVNPNGAGIVQFDGIMWQSYVGFRASANVIQVDFRNNYCQTSDWCIDSSPQSSIQGLRMVSTCWFGGTGSGVWHDVRIPNTFAWSVAVTFDNCLWEGPIGSWMVNSATPVGARNIFGGVSSLIFRNNQAADSGSDDINFVQNLPGTNGTPQSVKFDGGVWGTGSGAYLVYTVPNGTTNGIGALSFQSGLFGGGAGIWGGLAPSTVINEGGSFSPALPTTNLVNIANGGISLGAITVAKLPSASSNPGMIRVVSDSTAISTEGQTCVGSSRNTATAISNGTVWKCF